VEVEFYLTHNFPEQAQETVQALERQYPGDPNVAELRQLVERHLAAVREPVAPATAFTGNAQPLPLEPAAAPASTDEWELPETYAAQPPCQPTPTSQEEEVAAGKHEAASVEPGPAERGIREAPSAAQLPPECAVETAPSMAGAEPPPAPDSAAAVSSPLGDLLGGLVEQEGVQQEQGDQETLYNLGVAFREMGLLEEAIGEFQKLLRNAGKGNYPPHYLQACTLLALSFMDKKMPAIAARWYQRALESPDLDEAATLALHYDLGLAHEAAGEPRKALEQFLEVYSQNIDYRDVAEKIRLLQEKVS